MRRAQAIAAVAASLVLAGCASLPPRRDAPRTFAFDAPATTALGRLVRASAPRPAASGVRLLVSGEEAFEALLALAAHAERSLDLQYYIVRNDASSRTVLRELDRAADRGVRVRLLVDDLNTAPADESLLCLAAHPNIELRLYNPLPAGRFSTVTKVLASLTDAARINRRMHGKMLVADNALAVTGGRNIADAYFVRSPSSNFVDLDLLLAGPAVPALSSSFDRFWNSALAYPVGQLVASPPDCAGAVSVESESAPTTMPGGESPRVPRASRTADDEAKPRLARSLGADFARAPLPLAWVDATVFADRPAKLERPEAPMADETIADEIAREIASAREELVVVTPYFVPGPHGMALLRELRARGVAVKVLTNSLASTDAPVVHIGYARYRRELLSLGVEIHEMRHRLAPRRGPLGGFGSSLASLHAKAVVIDRRTVLAGSMNMDPRSARLNAEIALLLPDAGLAARLLALYEEVVDGGSYRLALAEDGSLLWLGEPGEPPRVDEPGAGLGTRLMLMLLAPFAPEAML